MQFLVDILPLGSGSVELHIFVDPDPGSQNLADPTDPDPKHCIRHKKLLEWLFGIVHKSSSQPNPWESKS